MSWGLVAVAGATVVGAAVNSNAAKSASGKQGRAAQRAADAQLTAQREALAAEREAQERSIAAQREALELSLGETRRQYDQTRSDFEPWRTTGVEALGQLSGLANFNPTPTAESVMAEPGYQFGLTQGRNVIEGSAAARGSLYSGQALKELTQFGNDYGTTKFGDAWNRQQAEFGNRWNRIASLAGVGQAATQQTAAAGQNFGNTAAGLYGNNANAISNAALQGGQQRGSILLGTAGNMGNIWMNNANAQGAAGMAQAGIWSNALQQLGGMGMSRWGGGGGGGNLGGSWNGRDFSGP
jgi:hypothetical protein